MFDLTCPECGSDAVIQTSKEYALYKCEDCFARFSEDDSPTQTGVHKRTKPRKKDWDNLDDYY